MWLLHPPKTRRRWHVFTWLAALPALAFVALVQVAGFERHSYGVSTLMLDYEHGWPAPWLERKLTYSVWTFSPFSSGARVIRNTGDNHDLDNPWKYNGLDISWSRPQAWPGYANQLTWHSVGILVNVLVAGLILAVPMAATEFWLRRRGGIARFRVLDFLVLVAAVAAIVGLWKWDRAVVRSEHEVASRAGFDSSLASNYQKKLISYYVGPEWLARLCGNERLVPMFHRFTAFSVTPMLIDEVDYQSLRELRHLTVAQVTFFNSYFSNFMVPGHGFECLAKLPQLETLVISNPGPSRIPPTNYSVLSKVETIVFAYQVPYEDLLELKGMPRLRTLMVAPNWYTPEELAALEAALPGVTIGPGNDPPPFIY